MMIRLALLCALICAHAAAWAHKASDSYLVVNAEGAAVTVQWDIALRDIDFALGLDGDGNGEITWGELRARRSNLEAWALSNLNVERGGELPAEDGRLTGRRAHRWRLRRAAHRRNLPCV